MILFNSEVFSLALIVLISLLNLTQAKDFVEFESVKLGKIRGTSSPTFGSATFQQFQGIPYGKVTGRFLPSVVRPGKLNPGPDGYFNATEPSPNVCVQATLGFSARSEKYGYVEQIAASAPNHGPHTHVVRATGSEDCLFLNIYTREVPTQEIVKNVPVIVFIHGGAFTSGFSNPYAGHRFLEEDIILVTFNYRLGVLGFFCLDTDEAPGNAALYDMVAALKWVQLHIAEFGGDPNSVTLMGQSAGAAAVIQLMSSPLITTGESKLFHKAIALSGSGANSWAITPADKARKASLRIAELMGCYTPVQGQNPDTVEITDCMSKVDDLDSFVNQLAVYQKAERIAGHLGFDAVSPVIQARASSNNISNFLEHDPFEVFEKGMQLQVPLVMGATMHDGTFPLGVLYNNFLRPNNHHDDPKYLSKKLVPDILQAFGIYDKSNAVYEAIAKAYLGEAKDSGNFTEMMPGLIDLHSVFFFKADTYKTLQLHAATVKNSYWYSFDYAGAKSFFYFLFFGNLPPVYGGIAHGDDLIYLFPLIPFSQLSREEMVVSRQMIKYFTNFASTGNPNSEEFRSHSQNLVNWPAYNAMDQQFLSLDLNSKAVVEYQGSWDSAADALIPGPITLAPASTTEATTLPKEEAKPSTTAAPCICRPDTTPCPDGRNNASSFAVSIFLMLFTVIIACGLII